MSQNTEKDILKLNRKPQQKIYVKEKKIKPLSSTTDKGPKSATHYNVDSIRKHFVQGCKGFTFRFFLSQKVHETFNKTVKHSVTDLLMDGVDSAKKSIPLNYEPPQGLLGALGPHF